MFFAPVALLVRTQAGVSESEFFLLQALLSCITALGEVPFGHVTDKIDVRAVCRIGHGASRVNGRGGLTAAETDDPLTLVVLRVEQIPEFLVGPAGRPVPAVGLGTASFPFVEENVRVKSRPLDPELSLSMTNFPALAERVVPV